MRTRVSPAFCFSFEPEGRILDTMNDLSPLTVTFWGVRGTMPMPSAEHLRYGGHTSCVEMRCGERRLIFDAGSGIYPLGETLTQHEIDIFLSHTHIDHIMGFPFFSPAFREQSRILLHGGHLGGAPGALEAVFDRLISPPLFPLRLQDFRAEIRFHDFQAGQPVASPHLTAEGIEMLTLPLNHPDCATAYRVNYKEKSVCYVTDVEHVRGGLDTALSEFIKGADLLIYDCTFDDRDFERFIGWGHSTWQQGVRLADSANVKQLAVFHHDPGRNDASLDRLQQELATMRSQDIVARQGVTVTV